MPGAVKPFLIVGLVTALVAFGLLSVIAARVRKTPLALGAHWPSEVILTAVVCLSWIWAASRVVLRRA